MVRYNQLFLALLCVSVATDELLSFVLQCFLHFGRGFCFQNHCHQKLVRSVMTFSHETVTTEWHPGPWHHQRCGREYECSPEKPEPTQHPADNNIRYLLDSLPLDTLLVDIKSKKREAVAGHGRGRGRGTGRKRGRGGGSGDESLKPLSFFQCVQNAFFYYLEIMVHLSFCTLN